MKLESFLSAFALAAASTALATGDHNPMHGGIVTPTKLMDYELVAKPATIHLYRHDHRKPADVNTASAKLALLSGTETQEVELKPAGNKLEATGSFKLGPGTKAVAVVTIGGKPASAARFVLK